MFDTTVIELDSGHEKRNQNNSRVRGLWDVAYGVRTMTNLRDIRDLFLVVRGRAYSFRFKDHSDYQIPDDLNGYQVIEAISGSNVVYQAKKTYTKDAFTFDRTIVKIVNGTLVVRDNSVVQTEGGGSDYTVDYDTGLITFNSTPTGPVDIQCEFDVCVRFVEDKIDFELVYPGENADDNADMLGRAQKIELVELWETD